MAETTLAIGRAKADDRGIAVEFAAADAFRPERWAQVRDGAGLRLFHAFDGDEHSGRTVGNGVFRFRRSGILSSGDAQSTSRQSHSHDWRISLSQV